MWEKKGLLSAFYFFLKLNKIKLFVMQSEMQNINIPLQKFDYAVCVILNPSTFWIAIISNY